MVRISMVRIHVVLGKSDEQKDVGLTDDEPNVPDGGGKFQSEDRRNFLAQVAFPESRARIRRRDNRLHSKLAPFPTETYPIGA